MHLEKEFHFQIQDFLSTVEGGVMTIYPLMLLQTSLQKSSKEKNPVYSKHSPVYYEALFMDKLLVGIYYRESWTLLQMFVAT